MKDRIEKLIASCPNAQKDLLTTTSLGRDRNFRGVKEVMRDFELEYENYLRECISCMGEPTYTEETDRSSIDQWYPEAIRISCWDMSDKLFYLSLAQNDNYPPVFVAIGCLMKDELPEVAM